MKDKVLFFLKSIRKAVMDVFCARENLFRLITFPIVFLWYEFLLRLFGDTPFFSHLIYPVLFAVSVGFLCAAIISLFKGWVSRLVSIAVLAAVAFYFALECGLRVTYQVYMDISSIFSGVGNVMDKYSGDVQNAFIGATGLIILYFLPVALWIIYILYMFFRKKKMTEIRRQPFSAIVLFVCFLIIGGVGTLIASNAPSVSAKYRSQFEFDTAAQTFGLFTGTRLDLKYAAFGNKEAETFAETNLKSDEEDVEDEDEEEDEETDYGYNVMDIDFDAVSAETTNEAVVGMDEYVSGLEPTAKNEYTGLFEGKNLIIIAAESFSSQVIDEELTPTLYRLANKGIKFTDFYQPAWGGSTSTGEYSILLGLVPTDGVDSILETVGDNLYFTMGNQLQREGYRSLAFHNGSYDYYGRDKTHKNLGYDQFLAWYNGLEDLLPTWSEDKETFEATLETYIDDQPFNAYYMSYSGHCTYDKDDRKTRKNMDRVKEVLGEDSYEDKTLYYFCYQLELEYALESMVGMLEDEGIADDTVIVLCTDHYPYGLARSSTLGNSEDYLLNLYKTDSYDSFLRDSTSLIIWSGCIEDMGLEVDTPVMSLDILPTLSNLFGLEYDSRLLVGRDVFSDGMPLVFWPNYSFVTEKGTYDAATGEFTSSEGEEADEDYINTIETIIENKTSYSSQAVKNDYWGVLFGKDEETGEDESD